MTHEWRHAFTPEEIAALKLSDLQWYFLVDWFEVTGKGREARTKHFEGIQTPIGVIEKTLWQQTVETIIVRDGEQDMQAHLQEWYKECAGWTDPLDPLGAHVRHLYDDEKWVDYIPFNRKYRPQLLAGRKFPVIRTVCCSKECHVTWPQIQSGYTRCAYCGRFGENEVIGESEL